MGVETTKKKKPREPGKEREQLQPVAELFCSPASSVYVLIKPALNTRKNTKTTKYELFLSKLPTTGSWMLEILSPAAQIPLNPAQPQPLATHRSLAQTGGGRYMTPNPSSRLSWIFQTCGDPASAEQSNLGGLCLTRAGRTKPCCFQRTAGQHTEERHHGHGS